MRYTPQIVTKPMGINAELTKIALAINDTLSRVPDTPNFMDTDLDMNSNRILNLPAPSTPTEPLRYQDLLDGIDLNIGTENFVASMKALPSSSIQDGAVYHVTGFYAGGSTGGGHVVFRATGSKSSHNGVTVYAPEALQAWAGTQADIATLLNWTGVGSGVWVRILNGFVTPEMAGAVGDGVADDTLSWISFRLFSNGKKSIVSAGNYNIGLVGVPNQSTISGGGPNISRLKRIANGNFLNAPTQQNISISGLELDLQRSANGFSGHGISTVSSDSLFENLTIRDFGSDLISGGGTGLLVQRPISGDKPHRARITNSTFIGDPECARSYGWIFSDVDYSFASNIYSSNIVGYAHELKNDSRFNSMVGLIGVSSNWSLAYGQETAGTDGSDMNVAAAIVAASCDGGYLIGEGFGNVLTGLVYSATGSPAREPIKNAVRYEGQAEKNMTSSVLSIGEGVTQTVRHIDSNLNYTQIAKHDDASVAARFDGSSSGNFVDVAHPGGSGTIIGKIVYGDILTLRGPSANVVHSPASGERIGTLSGNFTDAIGFSGAIHSTAHNWRYETDKYAFHAFGIPGNSGDEAGIAVNTATSSNHAQISYAKGASDAADFWLIRVGLSSVIRIYNTVFRPQTDNAYDIGNSGFRFRDLFAARIRPGNGSVIWTSGTGSPEGVITAPVGSMYTRTDGGLGTTLYIKESGAGATGWVAK